MNDGELARRIEALALSHGYDSCGILPVGRLEELSKRVEARLRDVPSSAAFYAGLKERTAAERFPWAKSVVICVFDYGRYRFPARLQGRYAKAFLLDPNSNRETGVRQKHLDLEQRFDELGIRWEGGSRSGPGSVCLLRDAAELAGLGIVRRNNFLYNENGSWLDLTGYVIDRECELIHSPGLKPCPPSCGICRKACPTGALCGAYTMDPGKCVSFVTTFGGGVIPPGTDERGQREWIMGCDACQDACPFNRGHDWTAGEEIASLTRIADRLLPENIIGEDDDFILREVVPRSCRHVTKEQTGMIRRNAERALRNREAALKEEAKG